MDHITMDVIALMSFLAFFGWGLYLFFRRYQTATHLQSQRIDSFNRMIEKFGSAKEFIDFAQSPQGKKILEEPAASRPNPMNKVLRFLQVGIVSTMVGCGFWLNGLRVGGNPDPNYVRQAMESNYWGGLLLFFGFGMLIVAGISAIFVRRWHLANGEAKQ
ncbi:MAG: hypothetical protein WBD36_08290 [Bacteroidota bacterium]